MRVHKNWVHKKLCSDDEILAVQIFQIDCMCTVMKEPFSDIVSFILKLRSYITGNVFGHVGRQ